MTSRADRGVVSGRRATRGRPSVCAAKPPSWIPIDNAERRANENAEWGRCAYSWEDRVRRCNADVAVSTVTPGVRIWSYAPADACPSRLVAEGEPCTRHGMMCPGGKTVDKSPDSSSWTETCRPFGLPSMTRHSARPFDGGGAASSVAFVVGCWRWVPKRQRGTYPVDLERRIRGAYRLAPPAPVRLDRRTRS